jgi:ABC-type transporter Mla maintaining outer membrane lipid asymmetry permease subunit MlaE
MAALLLLGLAGFFLLSLWTHSPADPQGLKALWDAGAVHNTAGKAGALAAHCLIGVLGLDLTIYSYITETQRSIELFDLVSSLIKAAVFAMLVAGIGCQRGFQVRGGAEAVGSATTSAVVAGIFLIIVTDSAFALVLHYIR